MIPIVTIRPEWGDRVDSVPLFPPLLALLLLAFKTFFVDIFRQLLAVGGVHNVNRQRRHKSSAHTHCGSSPWTDGPPLRQP